MCGWLNGVVMVVSPLLFVEPVLPFLEEHVLPFVEMLGHVDGVERE